MSLWIEALLIALASRTAGAGSPTAGCGPVPSNEFCSGVTWEAFLPIAAADLDAAMDAYNASRSAEDGK